MSRVTDIRSFVIELMGSNPYDGFDTSGYSLDVTGWQSQHPYFEAIIAQTKPHLILEVGTWKGASAINMANLAKRLDPTAQILCVDTWLGSHRDLWLNHEIRKQLNIKHGLPQQYFQFLANVVLSKLQDTIFPLPMTSYAATNIIAHFGLKFDVIYIDAHHDEEEVMSDIKRCFDLLRDGGTMFGDDYSVGERGVIRAVNRFAADHGLYLSIAREKWAIQKFP